MILFVNGEPLGRERVRAGGALGDIPKDGCEGDYSLRSRCSIEQ